MRIFLIFGVVLGFDSASAIQVLNGRITLERLEDYKECQSIDSNGQNCYEALLKWVEKNPQDSFRAGKLIRRSMSNHVAISFFSKAFESKKGNCKDEDVRKAVISALSLPSVGNESLIQQAKNIALETCSEELTAAVVLEAKSSDYVLKNSCRELLSKKVLSGIAAQRCLKM